MYFLAKFRLGKDVTAEFRLCLSLKNDDRIILMLIFNLLFLRLFNQLNMMTKKVTSLLVLYFLFRLGWVSLG